MRTSRRRRPLDRTVPCERDALLIVVATEGEKTESRYFSIFRSTKLQIVIIPSERGRSAPAHILDNLLRFGREFDLGEGDQLWLAIDRDRWPERALSSVARECRNRGWNLSVSNPCFELWLALHFDVDLPQPMDAKTLNGHLKALMGGYNKSTYDPALLKTGVRLAEARARALDRRPAERWPRSPGSRVFGITESFPNFE